MNPNDPRVDRMIARWLRAAQGDSAEYRGSLEALATRIDAGAAPLLAMRRQGSPRAFTWWTYAADWARALIPASVIVAAASVGFLWLLRTAEATPVSPSSVIAAAVRPCSAGRSTGCTQTEAVDRAVEELVTTADAPVGRPRR